MKSATIIFVLAALMLAPIACAVVVCPQLNKHDCCPKSKSFSACPLDILESAKAALPALVAVCLIVFTIPVTFAAAAVAESVPADDRDRHLHNRVLRI